MIGLLVAAVVVGVLIGRPPPVRTAVPSVVPSPTITEGLADVIVVHVSGAVVAPGLVEVPSDARVAEAIAAAGGVSVRADISRVNLAESIVDGQQIVVPSGGSEGTEAVVGATPDSRIRINDADAAALETLPGVGPVLAEAIVAHRTEYGAFRDVEDLLAVPGIGEQKLASLRERVIVP